MFHPPVLAQIFRDKEKPSEAPAKPRASGRGQSSPGKDPQSSPFLPGHAEGPSTLVAGLLTQAPGWASNGTQGRDTQCLGLALPWVRCFLSLAGLGRPGPWCGPEDLAALLGVLCGANAWLHLLLREAGCSRPFSGVPLEAAPFSLSQTCMGPRFCRNTRTGL